MCVCAVEQPDIDDGNEHLGQSAERPNGAPGHAPLSILSLLCDLMFPEQLWGGD